jgi:hypothetical protein
MSSTKVKLTPKKMQADNGASINMVNFACLAIFRICCCVMIYTLQILLLCQFVLCLGICTMIASVPILYISYNLWVFGHFVLFDILQYKPVLVNMQFWKHNAVALAEL